MITGIMLIIEGIDTTHPDIFIGIIPLCLMITGICCCIISIMILNIIKDGGKKQCVIGNKIKILN
jgi:hypothetical protein